MSTPSTGSAVRSVLSVLAGLIFVIVASSLVDLALSSAGVIPSMSDIGAYTTMHWLLALAYRSVIVVAGCWLAARLAPARPMRHALILGGIGFVIAVLGVIATATTGNMGPLWYPAALVVTALPCAWLGGRLNSGSAAS